MAAGTHRFLAKLEESTASRYALAAVCVAVAVLFHISVIGPFLHPTGLFLAAIVAAAWFGGAGPGFLAALFATLVLPQLIAMNYPLIAGFFDLPRFLTFGMTGVAVGCGTSFRRRAEAALRRSELELRMARNELEMKVAERTAELRRSEALLAEAQKLSQTGSFAWNVSTGEIFWSEETYRIAGYDLTTKPTLELAFQRIHPEDISRVREILDRASQGGTALDFEHRFLMPDGPVKHVHVLAHAVQDQLGNVEYVGAAMDITAERRAQDDLRKSEEKYRDLVDLSPDAIYVVDKEGNLVSANPAGLELLRCRAQDVVGMPVVETYLLEERAMYWERLKKLNAGSPLRFERIFVRKDNTQVPVEVSSSSIRNGYSQVVVRDISERNRAETKLRRSEAYLAEAQKLSQTGSWACTTESSGDDLLFDGNVSDNGTSRQEKILLLQKRSASILLQKPGRGLWSCSKPLAGRKSPVTANSPWSYRTDQTE